MHDLQADAGPERSPAARKFRECIRTDRNKMASEPNKIQFFRLKNIFEQLFWLVKKNGNTTMEEERVMEKV